MKNLLWLISGAAGSLAALIIFLGRRQPVEQLAHQLEAAWADHHTAA